MSPFQLGKHLLVSNLSLWRGTHIRPARQQPELLLELYDREGDPRCRLVREALTELDIDALIYPCPKGGRRFSRQIQDLGGKAQYPALHDPNTNTVYYNSHTIIEHLYKEYGQRPQPTFGHGPFISNTTSVFASLPRMGRGISYRQPGALPEQPLELYSFESSPYSRPVRELLSEYEIPYILHNIGKAEWKDYLLPVVREQLIPEYKPCGRNRKELLERSGRIAAPYLVDPNTGRELYESKQIIRYLRTEYLN
ncbi:glutathione S-transferase N-terminal domain-containing protein [Endozoicomonadaceae bacterium StTr2]